MRIFRVLALAAIGAQIGAAQADNIDPRAAEKYRPALPLIATGQAKAADIITEDASGLITEDSAIFAVLDQIEGDTLTLHLLNSVMSRNAETILFVGDEVRATLLPRAKGGTRRAACVTAILGREGIAKVLPHNHEAFPHPDCLASVNDFRGAGGLPADEIHLDQVTRIMLNGNLIFENHNAARVTEQPIDKALRCGGVINFEKKTWQPYKLNENLKTSIFCDEDGNPRPMGKVLCQLGPTKGTQWGFTDNHGRLIQVSACEPDHDDQK